MGPGAVAPQKSLIARADLHQRRGFSLLKDRLFAWVFLKDIADIAHRCALIRKLYGRVQRASRAILVIVPHLHDVVSRSIQVCKITVLAIDHAARRDTAIRVYDYRSVEIKARTRLGRLPKLLLLVGALDSPFKTLRIPAIGDFLAFKEFKRHAHGDEPQMINPQFFREHLSLFYFVLVLLHHDKLPLHNRKFIVMKQNEHEVEQAEVLAEKLGVDHLRFIPVGMPFEFFERKEIADRWYPERFEGRVQSTHEEQQFGQAAKPSPCFYLYRSVVVNPDGGVSPCCVVYRKNRDFADLNTPGYDVMKMWNNDKYRSARSLYSPVQLPNKRASVCDVCDIFEKYPGKEPVFKKAEPAPLVQIGAGD